jgi:uncharacterized membrane protein/thiol-disulfide isomerase/thioredoxin
LSQPTRKHSYGGRTLDRPLLARTAPNWILFGLALVGMALTAYLTVSALKGHAVAGCTTGSACDVVLGSRWSKLLGLPTSFWGFLAYAALAGIAFVKRADIHWKLAWIVALFGVLYSCYLTAIALFELKAACPYCLSSLVLMIAILGTVAYQRPPGLVKFSWTTWTLKTVFASLALLLLIHFGYTATWSVAFDPAKLPALAEHLTKTDAKFYGASWCPHCKDQKRMFAAAADSLPYVECSPLGRGSPEAAVCQAMNIQGYPTWIINGHRYEGVLKPEELARFSGFEPPPR